MKVKRQKHVRKQLRFYRNSFGYMPPYQVLVDGTFCKAALRFQVNISEQLPKYLESEVRLCTTPCVIRECKAFGPLLYGPLKVLRQYDTVACGHRPIPASKCLRRMAKREGNKYFIATQDPELSEDIRSVCGTALLYISHNAITLENPSSLSRSAAAAALEDKLAPSAREHEMLQTLKKNVFGDPTEGLKRKRKSKLKGANPLSCKRKAKARPAPAVSGGQVDKNRKRKTRNRTKVSETIKGQLLQQTHSSSDQKTKANGGS